ncbi:MAG: ABC transporter permease subunit [Acidobacteriota bacterium]
MPAKVTARLGRARAIDRLIAVAITVGGSLILLAVGFLMVFLFLECLPLLRGGKTDSAGMRHLGGEALLAWEDDSREQVAVLGSDATIHLLGQDSAAERLPLAGARAPLTQAVLSSGARLLAVADGGGALQVWSFRLRTRWEGQRRVLVPEARRLLSVSLPAGARLLAVAGDLARPVVLLGTADGAQVVAGGDDVAMLQAPLGAPALTGALTRGGDQAWIAGSHGLTWFALPAPGEQAAAAPGQPIVVGGPLPMNSPSPPAGASGWAGARTTNHEPRTPSLPWVGGGLTPDPGSRTPPLPRVGGGLTPDPGPRTPPLPRVGGGLTPVPGPRSPAFLSVPLAHPPTAAAVLLGDTTCLVGDAAGLVTAWQVVAGEVAGSRRLELTATFAGAGRVRGLAVSERDKMFAVLRDGGLTLAYLTTRRVLGTVTETNAATTLVGFSPRQNGLLALTRAGEVRRWSIAFPHPEVTLATLFLPVRYEGFTRPELVWQSTGGSSEFEAKLSLVPLLVGTFKGALWALLFSAPLALAAALYVSQFAPLWLRGVAKPVIELMAALPSVVVGFLAALVLAPAVERHLVGVLAGLVVLPVAAGVAGLLWGCMPFALRRRLGSTGELGLIAAVVATAAAIVALAERPLASALFPAGFPSWLRESAGLSFDQRNAVVVGFALGFAVIPIIFTLAEDAFANVPPALVSASLALGATPWQAARTVLLPAASPGLFAALMTGLGRAVGETMIVLMATGNTPILSLSPFVGMRTMSACIAVELPEAPFGGTLYRVLMLTALMLFALTFVLNTLAVVVSERLRARFGRLSA